MSHNIRFKTCMALVTMLLVYVSVMLIAVPLLSWLESEWRAAIKEQQALLLTQLTDKLDARVQLQFAGLQTATGEPARKNLQAPLQIRQFLNPDGSSQQRFDRFSLFDIDAKMESAPLVSRIPTANYLDFRTLIEAAATDKGMVVPVVLARKLLPLFAFFLALLAGALAWWRMPKRAGITHAVQVDMHANAIAQFSSPTASPPLCRPAVGTVARSDVGNPSHCDNTSMQQMEKAGFGKNLLQSLLDHLPVQVFVKSARADNRDQLLLWNKAAEVITGYTADAVLGKTDKELFPDTLAERFNDEFRKIPDASNGDVLPDLPFERNNGELRFLRTKSVPLWGHGDNPDAILGIVEDVTEQRWQERSLQAMQTELAAVNEASPLGLCRFDPQGNCTYANSALEKITGVTQNQLLNKRWRHRIHAEDRYGLLHEVTTWRSDSGEPCTAVCRLVRPDGLIAWISARAVPVMMDGKISGYVGSVDDITARRTSEMALLKSEQRLRLIADNIPALIAYVLPDERVAFANRRYEEAYGVLHEELCGMFTWEVLGPDVYEQSRHSIREALAGKPVRFERKVRHGDAIRFERVRYIPEFTLQGDVAGYFGLVEDITELKLVEAQLRKLVRFDSLTGLANRIQFEEKLADAIRHSRRNATLMAIMFLDIDHFKSINDTFGHQAGDEILREFGQRLLGCVRETDTVARLAGDEFVIILEGLSTSEEAQGVARKIIAAMETEFEMSGGFHKVTTSVGIAVRQENEEDAQALLRRADDAMYRAKSAGRNTFASLV